jgi:hypothetical protein
MRAIFNYFHKSRNAIRTPVGTIFLERLPSAWVIGQSPGDFDLRNVHAASEKARRIVSHIQSTFLKCIEVLDVRQQLEGRISVFDIHYRVGTQQGIDHLRGGTRWVSLLTQSEPWFDKQHAARLKMPAHAGYCLLKVVDSFDVTD